MFYTEHRLSAHSYLVYIWYMSHTQNIYQIRKKTILSILGDTCRRLVYVDEEGGRELKHQYLPYRNHYFWSRWLLRPAGRQACHWGCKITVWGLALGLCQSIRLSACAASGKYMPENNKLMRRYCRRYMVPNNKAKFISLLH